MSYTHYWHHYLPGPIPKSAWDDLCAFTREAIAEISGKCTATAGGYFADCPVNIRGPHGDPLSDPIISIFSINFNGEDSSDSGENLSHENFYLKRQPDTGDDFKFCKTARKPYDVLVVAVLIYAAEIGAIREWSSDGDSSDHWEGFCLLSATKARLGITTPTLNPPTQS